MNFEDYDPVRIAFRSTRGEGQYAKPRWTEFSVYFLRTNPKGGARWMVETAGCSAKEGERRMTRKFFAVSLKLALDHLQDTVPGRSVAIQAREWLRDNPDCTDARHERFTGATDQEALAWLYGADAVAMRGFLPRVARDFGLGVTTVRMALAGDAGLRVPLAMAARSIDRSAFRRASRDNDPTIGEDA